MSCTRTGTLFTCLDDDVADLFRAVHLAGDQAEEQLVIAVQQARRIDDVGAVDRRRRCRRSTSGAQHLRRIDRDVEFRPLPALDEHAGDAVQPIQPRLDVVGGQLPEIRLRHRVGRQAVADDREAREIEAMRLDLRGRRQAALHARHRGVDQLQRLEHVDVPVEEQVDLGRTAAGHRSDVLEARDGPDRLLERPRDRHLHLLDRHHAVVDADDDAREVGRRKHGHRKRQRLVDADDRQHADQEDDRLRVAREPVVLGAFVGGCWHRRMLRSPTVSSGSSSSFGGCDLHLGLRQHVRIELESSNAPVVATRWPLSRPSVTCTLPLSRMPT